MNSRVSFSHYRQLHTTTEEAFVICPMRKDKDERNDESTNDGWCHDEMCYIRCPTFQLQCVSNVNITLYTTCIVLDIALGRCADKFKFTVFLVGVQADFLISRSQIELWKSIKIITSIILLMQFCSTEVIGNNRKIPCIPLFHHKSRSHTSGSTSEYQMGIWRYLLCIAL